MLSCCAQQLQSTSRQLHSSLITQCHAFRMRAHQCSAPSCGRLAQAQRPKDTAAKCAARRLHILHNGQPNSHESPTARLAAFPVSAHEKGERAKTSSRLSSIQPRVCCPVCLQVPCLLSKPRAGYRSTWSTDPAGQGLATGARRSLRRRRTTRRSPTARAPAS